MTFPPVNPQRSAPVQTTAETPAGAEPSIDVRIQRIREIENAAGVLLGLTLAAEACGKLWFAGHAKAAIQEVINQKSLEFGVKAARDLK